MFTAGTLSPVCHVICRRVVPFEVVICFCDLHSGGLVCDVSAAQEIFDGQVVGVITGLSENGRNESNIRGQQNLVAGNT